MAIGAILLAVLLLGVVVTLLVRRQLREKYAALWIIIGAAVLVLGLFPELLRWMTAAFGFQLPANLLFTIAIILLLGVALHLSWELSRAEEEIRRLAEEVAILREAVERIEARPVSEHEAPRHPPRDE
ncbi:MAG: hypothetical protein ABS61_09275 [Microbacterium sp. SCN 70-18]|uniref:DUF2304 domain-containing protein n=1 Tax=Microbacterium sp. NPDC077184 TaxID=3154764 RepID=UPI00086DD496|nr:DUF2304 domain-containing protein [Microbacterium chocolatum]ODT10244.1 MAG: hypothetical protein ABS61_09275 [Microbacterium sp. SCN 70-18]